LIDYTLKKRKDAMDTKLLPHSNATNTNDDHAIIYYTRNIVQNDDPHKMELLCSKQSWNGVPLRAGWSSRHWEVVRTVTTKLRGLHIWTLNRKKTVVQHFV
jgi:hypothetical protein